MKENNNRNNIRDYHIIFYIDPLEGDGWTEVAEIKNNQPLKKPIFIVIDEWYLTQKRMRTMMSEEEDTRWNIIVRKKVYDRDIKDSTNLFGMCHELGHTHLMKYFPISDNWNTRDISSKRAETIKKGDVVPWEKAADLFGLYHTSQELMEEFFKRAIRERNMIVEDDDESKRLALEELRVRRDYLRQFKSENDIEMELCRICNHNDIDTL